MNLRALKRGDVKESAEERSDEGALRLTQLTVDRAADYIYWVSASGCIVYANESACRRYGYSKYEMVGLAVGKIGPSISGGSWPKRWQEIKAAGASTLETTHRAKDGELFPVEVTANYVADASGEYVIASVRDITQRRRQEEMLKLMQVSVERAADLVHWLDPQGRILFANEASCRLDGYSQDEMLSMRIFDLDPTLSPESWPKAWQRLKEAGSLTIESVHRTKSGVVYPVEVSANYVEQDGKEFDFVFAHNITERKRMEQSLKLTQFSVDHSADMVSRMTPDGRFVYANDTICRRLGYEREELVGLSIYEVNPQAPTPWKDHWQELKRRGSLTFESVLRTKTGEIVPVEVTANYVEYEGQEYNLPFARDITDRKRAEEALKESEQQLRQAQKMEAVGQLAGGIAHDFNNLLTAIIGNSSLALGAMAAEDPNRELIADIKETGERAAGLTRQILAFSRRQILKPQILQLNDIFLGMEPLLRRTLGEDIDLRFFLASDLRETEVDPHQMEQVLMNLVLNASDAMPEGGHLTVETANVTLDRKYARIHPEVEPGRYVTLSVTDTGCGMCEETRSRIFEPFFTTKEVGKGTGLGLSTVFGIVKQSGGSISVYSEPGTGSTFKAYLPVSVTVAAPEADSPLEGAMVRGSETILVVEDEASVRQLVVRILSRSGFAVLEAASAHELDAVLKGDGPVPDLLLTDVVLPGGTSGREVAEVLLARYPDLSVIFMSGYTRDSVVHNGRLDEGIEFLGKPFTPEMLSHKVRLVLDRRAAAGKKQSS